MNIVITILIIIVLLGILVGFHELGHLMVAKAFNVYCLEYSIGFGPKIFSRRYKGGETFFSLRAIPFGGYVSEAGPRHGSRHHGQFLPVGSLLLHLCHLFPF